ncbi:MAG: tRNA-dihydrouridine synthase [Planctomycetes bacterium]|nr:tRNA-dihydrouridine synthase [Planctomycetota bacterium]
MSSPVPELRIGPHKVRGRFALSPMAEFTSWPMRVLAQEFGAAFTCTEMVKAKFVVQRHAETMRELRRHPGERLCGGQLCGGDADELAEAARILAHELDFPFVDFNIACPIRRIVSDGAGSGLLSDPAKVERLVRVLREAAAPAPVTVKMRSGLDEKSITAVAVARAAEAGGAVLIALHPSTARQGYGGQADHAVVAQVKAAVGIPVVGGGDMQTPADAVRLMRESGCDAAYFARAAIGDPWIFRRAQVLFETGSEPPAPDPEEWRAVFRRHALWLLEHLGERETCLHLRKLSREYARRLAREDARKAAGAAMQKLERFSEFEERLDALIAAAK